jgi:hypothetical protein
MPPPTANNHGNSRRCRQSAFFFGYGLRDDDSAGVVFVLPLKRFLF